MVRGGAEERDGSLARVRVGAVAVMERQVGGDDIVPKFESKDGNRSGGNSLLLRSGRTLQVVHYQSRAITQSIGGGLRGEVIREGSSEQYAILGEK